LSAGAAEHEGDQAERPTTVLICKTILLSEKAERKSLMRLCGALAITILFMFGMTSGFAAPIERAVDSAKCKGIIARLIEATNTSFDHYSPSGDTVFLRSPKIVLSCKNHGYTGISLAWDARGFPPNAWFGLLVKAGKAVTGVDLKELESASRQCHRSALKDKTELAGIEISNAKIECQAFTRDGDGVNISIWINDRESRRGIEGLRSL
jgi:hypothetical protein